MNASVALARLRRLGVPALRTSDAAAALEQSTFAASQTLRRLASAALVSQVRHGLWWVEGDLDPYRLPEHLTAPMPSYVSLQSALHVHGAIEQIPTVVYVASLARSQRITTRVATFSIHHLAPEVFGGFEETASGVKLATLEKAFFDLAYLSGEVDLPRRIRKSELDRWLAKIPSARSRTLTQRRLEALLARAS
jgi:predicted transcriptional regulator of viral defense system